MFIVTSTTKYSISRKYQWPFSSISSESSASSYYHCHCSPHSYPPHPHYRGSPRTRAQPEELRTTTLWSRRHPSSPSSPHPSPDLYWRKRVKLSRKNLQSRPEYVSKCLNPGSIVEERNIRCTGCDNKSHITRFFVFVSANSKVISIWYRSYAARLSAGKILAERNKVLGGLIEC